MVGIICAVQEEIEALKTHMQDVKTQKIFNIDFYIGKIGNKECIATLCGVGKVNSARTTQLLIDNFEIEYVINVGVAGGLNPDVKIGDVVIGEKLVQHDFDISSFGHEKGELAGGLGKYMYSDKSLVEKAKELSLKDDDVNAIVGTIATGDQFIVDKEVSQNIRKEFGADCVEMEGGSIAQVCYLDNVSFIVLRSISDSPNNDNTIDYQTFVSSSSEVITNFLESFLQ